MRAERAPRRGVSQQMLLGGVVAAGATDPNFSSVKLLCHFDGTNGQTTTTDSSSAAHTLTRAGSTTLSSTQAKFGATSSTMTSGVGCWSTPDSADWAFGSGQFTVEAWVYLTSAPSGTQSIVVQFSGGSDLGWFLGSNAGNLRFYYSTTGSDNPSVGAAWSPTLNTWHHIAVDRDASNVLRVYFNGAVLASATVASSFFNSSLALEIGGSIIGWAGLLGFIDEVRITKGVARYGGAFTPPSAPFPNS